MKISKYLLPVLKETPKEAAIPSHQLMLRAGMIRQLTSGIYEWMPLGLKVLRKVEKIVREEMDKAGCLEILMPMLQPKELWEESGRGDAYGKERLEMQDRHGRTMIYGPTAEEVVTDIFRKNVVSYKDLPMVLYNIQWKFRDEIRPRFGLMRGREFLMKDAYSFNKDKAGAEETYYKMYEAYVNIFKRIGVKILPAQADSGEIGGDMSHEFMLLADTGESEVFYDKKFEEQDVSVEELKKIYVATDEIHKSEDCPISKEYIRSKRGIELGHIFYLGQKYTEALNAKLIDENGKEFYPEMGCYGLGISRIVAGLIEASYDDSGIVWPEAVAPFAVGLINIRTGDEECDKACEDLYNKLNQAGIETLYDDRKISAGQKFGTMDLIGLPYQVVIGPRGLKEGKVEFKQRNNPDEKIMVDIEKVVDFIKGK